MSINSVLQTRPLWCQKWDLSNLYHHHGCLVNAAVNGHLELPRLKDRQRFDAVSTSNLEVYQFRDWWILTYFIFGHGESSLKYLKHGESWTNVRFIVLLFPLFESESWPRKNKSAWWIFTQLYFRGGESWLNYFWKEVNWWWILTKRFCWKGDACINVAYCHLITFSLWDRPTCMDL